MSTLIVAWRSLRRAPAFAIAAALTLSIGIGATTSIFAVLNTILLKPLPYREPSRLTGIWFNLPGMSFHPRPTVGVELLHFPSLLAPGRRHWHRQPQLGEPRDRRQYRRAGPIGRHLGERLSSPRRSSSTRPRVYGGRGHAAGSSVSRCSATASGGESSALTDPSLESRCASTAFRERSSA